MIARTAANLGLALVVLVALYAIYINELADINYRARMLGTPRPISQEDQDVFRRMGERAKKSTPGKPGPREAALWRYYVALTDS